LLGQHAATRCATRDVGGGGQEAQDRAESKAGVEAQSLDDAADPSRPRAAAPDRVRRGHLQAAPASRSGMRGDPAPPSFPASGPPAPLPPDRRRDAARANVRVASAASGIGDPEPVADRDVMIVVSQSCKK